MVFVVCAIEYTMHVSIQVYKIMEPYAEGEKY